MSATSAQRWGKLWGARSRDYADFAEGSFYPVYERLLVVAGVGARTRLLDVGCGPGLAAEIAARRGALVAGLDAAEDSVAIARQRTPGGDFRVGDMAALPWPDRCFDAVTGFNAFQFADDVPRALREARRVLTPGGRLGILVWGDQKDCDLFAIAGAVARLVPSTGGRPPTDAFAPDRIGLLLDQAGLRPITSGQIEAWMEWNDLESATRATMSAGTSVAVAEQVGEAPARQAIAEALMQFQAADGVYQLRNTFRYVVSEASDWHVRS
jgi:ubiquinone/menaquinone biosynthesis C-methylase UbiE